MDSRDATIYKMGIAFTPGVNADVVRRVEEVGLELKEFFELDTSHLSDRLFSGRGFRFEKMSREEALARARQEMKFVERHGLNVYFLNDADYPMRLREIPDAPPVLYQIGDTDLDAQFPISIVGTRKSTSYAASFCDKFIKELAGYFPDAMVVSGLAYGIDAMAHRGALEHRLPTVGVMAHGLDTIYPASHRDLARRIIKEGGSIISEYPSGTPPFQKRFLERNRIVAGMSDFTLIVESPVKGGSMNTANLAFSYSREVGAVPGRISDPMSEGCNLLIRRNKATLTTGMADVIEATGWKPAGIPVTAKQRNLFPELEGIAREIYEFLKIAADPVNTDAIFQKTRIPIPQLTSSLTELEFDGVVIRHPGNRFSLA